MTFLPVARTRPLRSSHRRLTGPLARPDHPLIVFHSSPEFDTPEPAFSGVSSTSSNLPCGSYPFDVFPVPGSHSSRGYQPSSTCPLSVSHALRALLHPVPAGLVSCRYRPWGSTLQGSSHPRSRTPSRTPLPSCGYPAPGDCVIPPTSGALQGVGLFHQRHFG